MSTATVAAATPTTPWSTAVDGLHLTLRPLDLEADLPTLHGWLRDPHAAFWEMQHVTLEELRTAYTSMAAVAHENAWIGLVDGVPSFFVETYDPQQHPLAEHLDVTDDDLGMHVLISAPAGSPRSGFTTAIMRAVARFCFAFGAGRIIVEPDARNEKILAKNAAVGFRRVVDAQLPDKLAALSVCTRTAFEEATAGPAPDASAGWEHAARLVTAKALGEYAHERLLTPTHLDGDRYEVSTPQSTWAFTARRHALDHWHVLPESITRHSPEGTERSVDPLDLVVEFQDALGLSDERLATYVEELSTTVAHRVRTTAPGRPSVRELLDAAPHEIEAAMAEGHPCFVATNGRIGFSADDLRRYAPESGTDGYPMWAAVPRETSHLAHSQEFPDENGTYDEVLGTDWHAELRRRMEVRGIESTHRLMPVHPWQWQEKILTTLAPDVAAGRIVFLGRDPDAHRPAQSIRTWLDVENPRRPHVKTSLSIRNMGFVRGLSAEYMRGTPAINDHVAQIVRSDPEFAACHFDVLREYASIGYTGDAFHEHDLGGHRTKMMAALWRESPASRLGPDARTMTMAALLHRDPAGAPFVVELVRASGLDARTWVDRYLRAFVRPILHLLCEHRLAFIPHGENIILVMQDHVVTGCFLKDIGEEVGLMDDGHARPLPADVERIRITASSEDIALSLFTDVFDGFLRFLAPIVDEAGLLDEDAFWSAVRECLDGYAADHPDAARSLPLLEPTFARSCLNRLQLRDPEEMVQLDDAVGSLIRAGDLPNPIA